VSDPLEEIRLAFAIAGLKTREIAL